MADTTQVELLLWGGYDRQEDRITGEVSLLSVLLSGTLQLALRWWPVSGFVPLLELHQLKTKDDYDLTLQPF
jgi:hypothetical protein